MNIETIILKRILPKEYQKYDVIFYDKGILGGYCEYDFKGTFFNETVTPIKYSHYSDLIDNTKHWNENNDFEKRITIEERKYKLNKEVIMLKAKTPKGD
jgi:hypothetical protein